VKKIRLSILGATGSIGRSAASVAQAFPDLFEVVALAAGTNVGLLSDLVSRFRPGFVSVKTDAERALLIKSLKGLGLGKLPEVGVGEEGLRTAATLPEADQVLSAVSGALGLLPTFAALAAGKKVALANKESLVIGGGLLGPNDRELISPVDSEHSAVFQALGGSLDASRIRRLVLTASGGPFRGYDAERLKTVTYEEALSHPNWSMGPKITIDSATLLNKGFEVIEAHHLFRLPYDSISVVVHPQSVIHSLVEYPDGSMIAQLGPTDMRLAIAYALTNPTRLPLLDNKGLAGYAPFPFDKSLSFEEPDRKVFRALALAEAAGRRGGSAPAILNAAGEVAVSAFLAKRIPFHAITDVLEDCLGKIPVVPIKSLEDALAADKDARGYAEARIPKYQNR
jgi:1-deoxy-D-xylulose-5-phosphate reductoisomerase